MLQSFDSLANVELRMFSRPSRGRSSEFRSNESPDIQGSYAKVHCEGVHHVRRRWRCNYWAIIHSAFAIHLRSPSFTSASFAKESPPNLEIGI